MVNGINGVGIIGERMRDGSRGGIGGNEATKKCEGGSHGRIKTVMTGRDSYTETDRRGGYSLRYKAKGQRDTSSRVSPVSKSLPPFPVWQKSRSSYAIISAMVKQS